MPDPSNQQRILAFLSRHRLASLTVAAIVGFFLIYGYTRRTKPFPHWDDERRPQPVAQSSAATQPASPDLEQQSRAALYDPENKEVDPKYQLPTQLSGEDLHQLILNMECLVDLAKAHDQLLGDYNKLYAMLTDPQVKEVFFWRIKNQKGFKEPQLPIRWREFSDASTFNKIEGFATSYVNDRVERMRYRIIGGQYTVGDVKFVSMASTYYSDDIPKLADWISKARQLNQWMIDDQIVTPDTTVKTSLDDYSGAQNMIATIRRVHADNGPAGSSLQPVARVTTNGSQGRYYGDDAMAASEFARKQATAKFTPAQRADFILVLDHVAQATTVDIRFVPPPPKKSKPGDQWAYMDADVEKKERAAKFPLLAHARDAYDAQKEKIAALGDRLSQELPRVTAVRAKELSFAYKIVSETDTSRDADHQVELSRLIQDLKQRDLTHSPVTVGEVAQIQAGEAWANERLKLYATQQKMMQSLLEACHAD